MRVIKENLYTWHEISGFCDISSGLTVGQKNSLRLKIKDSLVLNQDYRINQYNEVMFLGHCVKKVLPIVRKYKSKVENKKRVS